jgi:hypothetical protein
VERAWSFTVNGRVRDELDDQRGDERCDLEPHD